MTTEQNNFLTMKSLLAGILIGIGACAYTKCSNQYLGAFLFSFGLLGVLNFEALLFTGKIGYFNFKDSNLKEEIFKYIEMLCYNMAAILIVGLLTFNFESEIFINKLAHSLIQTFISSIFCGVMMYLAVDLWKKNKSPIYVIMAIMIFILAGFDHCIANMYYFAINPIPAFTLRTLFFFIINIIGNSIGSLSIRYLINGK